MILDADSQRDRVAQAGDPRNLCSQSPRAGPRKRYADLGARLIDLRCQPEPALRRSRKVCEPQAIRGQMWAARNSPMDGALRWRGPIRTDR
jgi:hypothetical protein